MHLNLNDALIVARVSVDLFDAQAIGQACIDARISRTTEPQSTCRLLHATTTSKR